MLARVLFATILLSAVQARAEAPPEQIYGRLVTALAIASVCKIELNAPGSTRRDLMGMADRLGKRVGATKPIDALVAKLAPMIGEMDCARAQAPLKALVRSSAIAARRLDTI